MNVVDLAQYRERRAARRRGASAPEYGAVYFCRRCGGEHFILRATGDVHCFGCGARMSNVAIAAPRRDERGDGG